MLGMVPLAILSGWYISRRLPPPIYFNTRIGKAGIHRIAGSSKKLKTKLNKNARILLIGAGQTNQLVAKFPEACFTNVVVFNRSLGKAKRTGGDA